MRTRELKNGFYLIVAAYSKKPLTCAVEPHQYGHL